MRDDDDDQLRDEGEGQRRGESGVEAVRRQQLVEALEREEKPAREGQKRGEGMVGSSNGSWLPSSGNDPNST